MVDVLTDTVENVRCVRCGLERPKPQKRLPRGWKRLRDEAYCPDCWRLQYILRAIIIPVASPVDCRWDELRNALRSMWTASTQVSNWMLTELYARDVRRSGEEKMPPMGRVYLYPEARIRFPQLPSQSIAALENTVQARYRAFRYQVIWACTASLPVYRYPIPFPISNQSWDLEMTGNATVISARIAERRLRLRLKGGPRFRRQRSAMERIASGDAIKGELAIYQAGTAILCKMVVWLPREECKQEKRGTLDLRAMRGSLIGALEEKGKKVWIYNGDHVRRWVAEHRKQLQRWSEDHKAEHRPNPPFADRRNAAVKKYHDRMTSICHQISAMIVGYAERKRFAVIQYDDTDQGFCPEFPWFQLRTFVLQKADAAGIKFEYVDDSPSRKKEGQSARKS